MTDRKQVEHALHRVQSMSGDEIDKRISSDLLGAFSALARAMEPGIHDDDLAKRAHLMVLAYLMAREIS